MENKKLRLFIAEHLDDGRTERSAWISLFNLTTRSKIVEPGLSYSARIASVERALAAPSLESIDDWDDKTAEQIIDYLIEIGYESELKVWIADESRFNLDPERVEEIEKVVKNRFDL